MNMKKNKTSYITFFIGIILILFFLFYHDFSFKRKISSNLILKKIEGGDLDEDYYLYDNDQFPVVRDVIRIRKFNNYLIVYSKDYQDKLGYYLVDKNNDTQVITVGVIDSLEKANTNHIEIWKKD